MGPSEAPSAVVPLAVSESDVLLLLMAAATGNARKSVPHRIANSMAHDTMLSLLVVAALFFLLLK